MWGMEYVDERKRLIAKIIIMTLYAGGFLTLLVFSFLALPKNIPGLWWIYLLTFICAAITICGILKPEKTAIVIFVVEQTLTFRRDLDAEANIVLTTILFISTMLINSLASLYALAIIITL